MEYGPGVFGIGPTPVVGSLFQPGPRLAWLGLLGFLVHPGLGGGHPVVLKGRVIGTLVCIGGSCGGQVALRGQLSIALSLSPLAALSAVLFVALGNSSGVGEPLSFCCVPALLLLGGSVPASALLLL